LELGKTGGKPVSKNKIKRRNEMKKAYMIIDGQWGSTRKGLISGYLSLKYGPDTVVNNFGPNAGHTVVLPDGEIVMTQMLPSAIISPFIKNILIGAGAIIDPLILDNEIEKYKKHLRNKNIFIHGMASIVTQEHRSREVKELGRISSTCKGTGAAQSDKMMRVVGSVARDFSRWNNNVCVINGADFIKLLKCSNILQIESAQGLELGINSGEWFPYCTSRDINVHQVLSDCSIPYGIRPEIIVSMRTYPIRVGDMFDIDGNKVGTSGPVYDDQDEISWGLLGVKDERTTVTKKIRRVFTWSDKNFEKVVNIINPDDMFLNFVNYYEENPTFSTPLTSARIFSIEKHYERLTGKCRRIVKWIGTGPKINDIIERN
jgi:adenylosuccinate synthase